jgi:hypothetical protein
MQLVAPNSIGTQACYGMEFTRSFCYQNAKIPSLKVGTLLCSYQRQPQELGLQDIYFILEGPFSFQTTA